MTSKDFQEGVFFCMKLLIKRHSEKRFEEIRHMTKCLDDLIHIDIFHERRHKSGELPDE